MGFTAKDKSNNEGWGMGFFLVFFPEDHHESIDMANKKSSSNLFSPSSSPSSSPSPSPSATTTFKSSIIKPSPLRRTTSNHILSRAQSTISICALLFFTTFLIFTLSTFEPTTGKANRFSSRRHLSSNPSIQYKPWSEIFTRSSNFKSQISVPPNSHALQGLGILYSRGTKAMNDLVVGHISESVTQQELRLFLRLLHRSGLTSKSDLVLIFPPSAASSAFGAVIREENESFLKLVKSNSTARFDSTQFEKSGKKEKEWGEPIWGRRIRSNSTGDEGSESTRLSYGSVVGFGIDELDPENSLAGFVDHVPMSLRRWASYPMLLGRLRRNFKHIMLVDVKEILLLGDPLGRVITRMSPETVHLLTESTPSNKHGKKNSPKSESHGKKPANPAVVMGGARGIRRISGAMLTAIVRATTQHKRKTTVTESVLFNQLVGNEFLLNNVKVVTSAESVPEASSLTGSEFNSGSALSLSNYTVVRRGISNVDVTTSALLKQICSLQVESSLVYSDC